MLQNLVMLGADTGSTGAFDVTAGLEVGKQAIEWTMGIISGNPILAACFIIGTIIPAGIGAFAYFKHAAK